MKESDIEDYVRWFTAETEWMDWDTPWESHESDADTERQSWTKYINPFRKCPTMRLTGNLKLSMKENTSAPMPFVRLSGIMQTMGVKKYVQRHGKVLNRFQFIGQSYNKKRSVSKFRYTPFWFSPVTSLSGVCKGKAFLYLSFYKKHLF